ncbi:hypothetical protein TUM19329_26580 [Legionella antarctica]|uniref:Cyclic nucleotide-binding domain-containing protein n=1 Tax=Legionella antarctica TaxID=2708020 RepID=A0A6F8T816_9GAMM|nr:hypothetical protein [Legionella antarctica]BCA96297.1 hypothetical protein TUM19329_26580 [Legionella antarctica]
MEITHMEHDNSPDSILKVLQKSSLSGSLSSKKTEQIALFFKITRFGAHEPIINEHGIPIDLYVIAEGVVEILKKIREWKSSVYFNASRTSCMPGTKHLLGLKYHT